MVVLTACLYSVFMYYQDWLTSLIVRRNGMYVMVLLMSKISIQRLYSSFEVKTVKSERQMN